MNRYENIAGTLLDIFRIGQEGSNAPATSKLEMQTVDALFSLLAEKISNELRITSSHGINLPDLTFTEQGSIPNVPGRLGYVDKSLALKTDIAGSTQSVGQEFWYRIINKSGATIQDGVLVYVSGFDAGSGRAAITLAKADSGTTADVLGFTTSKMANGQEGFVTRLGFVNDLDTSGETPAAAVFLSSTVAGGFTTIKPALAIPVGFITKVNATTGQILVAPGRDQTTLGPNIFANLASTLNQDPIVLTPVVIPFNTQIGIAGITHSTTINPEEITIDVGGTYTLISTSRVSKSSGGPTETHDIFGQIDDGQGGGFVDAPFSNARASISVNNSIFLLVRAFTNSIAAGTKIRFLQRISNTNAGMGIKFEPAEVGPPTIPATPSATVNILRVGAAS